MTKAFQKIDELNRQIARAVGWVMLFVMLLTVADVVLRRYFSMPIQWAFDLSTQLFALHFMLAAACAVVEGEHVSVDVFRKRMSPRGQAILELLCYFLFFFPFCLALLKYGWDFAGRSWASRETSGGFVQLPVYYIKTVIPITAAMLILQGISMVAKLVDTIRGGHAA